MVIVVKCLKELRCGLGVIRKVVCLFGTREGDMLGVFLSMTIYKALCGV